MFGKLMKSVFGPSAADLEKAEADRAYQDWIEKTFVEDLNEIFTKVESPHWNTITQRWDHVSPARSQTLRLCQIFISSHRHAMNSKNPSTSRPNAEYAQEMWSKPISESQPALKEDLAKYLPDYAIANLDARVQLQFAEYRWRRPLNEAHGQMDKAAKLKTMRARQKHLGVARSLMDSILVSEGNCREEMDEAEVRYKGLVAQG